MYINYRLLKSKGLTSRDLMILQICKQNKSKDENLSEILAAEVDNDESVLKTFEEDGLITFVKSKGSIFEKARISKKGDKLLHDLQTFKVEEEDITVYEWLKAKYIEVGKEIGSEKKGLELCSWFRRESGISQNNLVRLCKAFMSDDDRMQYSLVLQYIFWKPENHFQTNPKLEDSKLWLYYEKHRDHFDSIFDQNN